MLANLPIKTRVSLGAAGDVVLVDSKDLVSAVSGKQWNPNRNVFLLSGNGQVVWEVESGMQSHGVQGFENVYLGPNGELMAYSANGVEYVLDAKTGRILSKELVR
jgi:hypothetical protein